MVSKRAGTFIMCIATSAILLTVSGCSSNEHADNALGFSNSNTDISYNTIASSGALSDAYFDTTSGSSSQKTETNTVIKDAESNYTEDESDQTLDVTLEKDKLVYTANVHLETTDFNNEVDMVKDLAESYGGVIQDESYRDGTDSYSYYSSNTVENRYAQLTIRIPSDKYDAFTSGVKQIGHLTNFSYSVDNISNQYNDTQAYIESYENQIEQLNKLYSQATTVSEVIEIESRISEVQTLLDRMRHRLQVMDIDVRYSTFYIYITEVSNFTLTKLELDNTPWYTKAGKYIADSATSFMQFMGTTVLGFIYTFWYIMITILIVAIVKFILYKKHERELRRFKLTHRDFIDFAEFNGLDPYKAMVKYKKNLIYSKNDNSTEDSTENSAEE